MNKKERIEELKAEIQQAKEIRLYGIVEQCERELRSLEEAGK